MRTREEQFTQFFLILSNTIFIIVLVILFFLHTLKLSFLKDRKPQSKAVHNHPLPIWTLGLYNNVSPLPSLPQTDNNHNSYGCWRCLSPEHKQSCSEGFAETTDAAVLLRTEVLKNASLFLNIFMFRLQFILIHSFSHLCNYITLSHFLTVS